MACSKNKFLTTRGRTLMRQEGREVLAVPLHPSPHASFVGVHLSCKRSAIKAWSKQKKVLNIPPTWCSLQNQVFPKTAQTTTSHPFVLFWACCTRAHFLFNGHRSNQSGLPARSKQFKGVSTPFPRRLHFSRRQVLGYENGSNLLEMSWVALYMIEIESFRHFGQTRTFEGVAHALKGGLKCQYSALSATTSFLKLRFSPPL